MIRSPATSPDPKRAFRRTSTTEKAGPSETNLTEKAGPSETSMTEKTGPTELNRTATLSVRRSIGEWESGGQENKNTTPTPPKANVAAARPQRVKTAPSTESISPSSKTTAEMSVHSPIKPKQRSRVAEARACLTKAKLHLGNSRNLRTDIKNEVTNAIERLYQLVKEAENARDSQSGSRIEVAKATNAAEPDMGNKQAQEPTTEPTPSTALINSLMQSLQEHGNLVTECKQHTLALTGHLKSLPDPKEASEGGKTYAQGATKNILQMHSIKVTSTEEGKTSGEVIEAIRTAVNAKNTGICVEKLRKAKDQKVIVGCSSREELARVAGRIRDSGAKLQVESIANKDPLMILRDVLSYNTDADIVASLRSQNGHLLDDINAEDQRIVVKYRRRSRNPHACHVVLQTSPLVWQRITTQGKVHIDLQRIRVMDQSPLIQCSMCLGYGHGKRHCTETVEKCSHCGGPHMWSECADRLVGTAPTCCNCTRSKLEETQHNAFSPECAVRRKWDSIARSAVAYC